MKIPPINMFLLEKCSVCNLRHASTFVIGGCSLWIVKQCMLKNEIHTFVLQRKSINHISHLPEAKAPYVLLFASKNYSAEEDSRLYTCTISLFRTLKEECSGYFLAIFFVWKGKSCCLMLFLLFSTGLKT